MIHLPLPSNFRVFPRLLLVHSKQELDCLFVVCLCVLVVFSQISLQRFQLLF
jgi:hypothetical protein